MARHRSDAPPPSPGMLDPGTRDDDVSVPLPRSGRPHRYLDPDRAEHSQELPVAPRHTRRAREGVDGDVSGAAPRTPDVSAAAPSPRIGTPSGTGPVPPPRSAPAAPSVTRSANDPETTPLDLAAIALAAARTHTGSHRLPGPDLGGPTTTGGHAVGGTSGFARPGRLLNPSRTVGALAVLGAIAGAGVAAAGSGSMLTAEPASAAVETTVETTGVSAPED